MPHLRRLTLCGVVCMHIIEGDGEGGERGREGERERECNQNNSQNNLRSQNTTIQSIDCAVSQLVSSCMPSYTHIVKLFHVHLQEAERLAFSWLAWMGAWWPSSSA